MTTTSGSRLLISTASGCPSALPNPVEWAPELVAEAANGNGHVAEDELEACGRLTPPRPADWGLPQP